jgi:hypothetical protein
VVVGTKPHFIYICGEAPDVKICGQLPYELRQPCGEEAAAAGEGVDTAERKQEPRSIDFVSDLFKKLKDHNLISLGQQQRCVIVWLPFLN